MTTSSASPHAHRYSIDMLIDAGSLDRARTQLTSALATWPDDAELLATGARLDLRAGHLPGALWYANSALRRNPTNTQALRIRSLIQAADGFCYDAQIDALAAIRIEPHQAANHYVLAYAYNEEGRKKDALASINEALRLAPENVAYLNFRGSLKTRAIGNQDALEDFAAALQINPQDGPTLQNIGQTQSRQWQLTRSLRTYLDAAAHDVHSAKRSRIGIAATMRRIAIFMSSLNLAALAIIGFNAHRGAPPDPGSIALLARLCALVLIATAIVTPLSVISALPYQYRQRLWRQARYWGATSLCIIASAVISLTIAITALTGNAVTAQDTLTYTGAPALVILMLALTRNDG
ncbi:Hypothetical conserved TPR domain protein [Mycobacteroides abscessus subsp. massiliense]|uniref:tetratricopeptide repeat protein n=1 Tax=Mycobacteroides abscessus TaxID=36809 RepID=UPI0009C5ED05|nr:hypothetical protein [Mycobacteroides abscessus]SKT85456.1 Hypothetical conserved TPR domain protein [Mycobacteroides abscessus subsp. massiliense]